MCHWNAAIDASLDLHNAFFTSLAWIATVATETLFAGTMLQGLIVLDYPTSYIPTHWQGTLLTWLVSLVSTFINVVIFHLKLNT